MNYIQRNECCIVLVVTGAGFIFSYLFDGPTILLQIVSRFCLQQDKAVVSLVLLLIYLGICSVVLLTYKLYYLTNQVRYLSKREKELRFYSYYDLAAGTYNRNAFVQKAKLMEKQIHDVAVLMCDIDGLKLVNDTLGHNAGDELIRTTADILNKYASSTATVYRMGGDEFLLLFTELKAGHSLEELAQTIRQAITRYNQKELSLPLSLSIGWAMPQDGQTTLTDLMKLADSRMYQEKRACKEKVRQGLLQVLSSG